MNMLRITSARQPGGSTKIECDPIKALDWRQKARLDPIDSALEVDSTSKCTTESALDDFSCRAVAEAFARSIIQVIYDRGKMFVTDLGEISSLREVST